MPVVTTNHGPYRTQLLDIYRAMDRHAAIVATSHHQASTAEGVHISRVIHHGIDVDAVPIGDGTGGYFCFLGRMSPRKGVREAALVAHQAGVPLRIAAKIQDPTEQEYFDRAVAPLLDSEVEFLGELNSTEKYALLGGATARLNPVQCTRTACTWAMTKSPSAKRLRTSARNCGNVSLRKPTRRRKPSRPSAIRGLLHVALTDEF